MENKICQNCRHASKNLQQLNQYICRRYPPHVFGVFTPEGLAISSSWPIVVLAASCGEFAVRDTDNVLVMNRKGG